MNNLIVLTEPEEVEQFLFNLWRSTSFRDSHRDAQGYVRRWVRAFCRYPRIFYSHDDFQVEKAHFTPWMNAFGFRHYQSAALHDLYWLHDIVHAVLTPYPEGPTPASWATKMIDVENQASLETEVLIYFAMPALRRQTLDFEIWADRWLRDPDTVARMRTDPSRTIAALLGARRSALHAPADAVEEALSFYAWQNQEWLRIWAHQWAEVEAAMRRFRARVEGGDRAGAIAAHVAWLTGHVTDPARPYPFAAEAHAFAEVYWQKPFRPPTSQE